MDSRNQQERVAHFLRQWWNTLPALPSAEGVYAGTNWPSIEDQPPPIELVLYFVRQACPDASFFIEEILVEQQIMARWQVRGADTQGFQGRVPTNREIVITGLHIVREEQEHFVPVWHTADLLSLFLQFGFICLPQQPRITVRWKYNDAL